jgi:tetratricopeptide (TPR) repeat protein
MDIQIAHVPGDNDKRQPLFEVVRLSDGGKRGPKVELTPPQEFLVEGVQGLTLLEGLRWYLEDFLETPYGAYLDRADKVQKSLVEWGKQCFDALFSGQTRVWLDSVEGTAGGLIDLHLRVASDEPSVLAWPWEALYHPSIGELALQCSIERQLSTVPDTRHLPDSIRASSTINILYVISRPDGEGDVDYHSLVRSLTDYARGEGKGRVHIDVLRPPTFNELRDTLRKNPGYYHIVHFDGHGGYGEFEEKWQGVLAFEDKKGKQSLVGAEKLGTLLREHNIPVFVLNACQSAKIDGGADGPLASAAAALLKAGARSVVAMSHSLFVSAAKVFIPAFYERLFEGADIAEALRAGRQQMYQDSGRPCMIGTYDLKDWLIPTLYQQLSPGESVLPGAAKRADALSAGAAGVASGVQEEQEAQDAQTTTILLPPEVEQLGDYPFLGRGQEILRLERAMRHRQAAILVHGMAGIGKTTLAKGFLQWLRDTGGIECPPLWFAFDDIRSAEHVVNGCLEHMGFKVGPQPLEDKLKALTGALRKLPVVMVWDNFESASGIEGAEVTALLDEDDRDVLKRLVHGLRGGKARIIITSRSREGWLTVQECYRPGSIEGLAGEDLWEYCNAVLDDIDPVTATNSGEFKALLDRLQGNPLYIRSVLLRLEDKTATELSEELDAAFAGAGGDDATRHLVAALSVLGSGLDPSFSPVLQCVGLFDRCVPVYALLPVLSVALNEDLAATAKSCLQTLEKAGLGQCVGDQLFRMHPALRGYLQSHHPADGALRSVFERGMLDVAVQLDRAQAGEQRAIFGLFGSTLYHLAEQTADERLAAILWIVLAGCFCNNRNLKAADALCRRILETSNDDSIVAESCFRLGRVAEALYDLDAAEEWYKKSLEIHKRQGDEHAAAAAYQQLGWLAKECRDLDAAEEWYKKSLEIHKRQGDEQGIASACHNLGVVTQNRRDFAESKKWYEKSLETKLCQNNKYEAASTYYQLGRLAEDLYDFAEAEEWYEKSLEIFLRQGDEHRTALTYHQLGFIAQNRSDFAKAKKCYERSMKIFLHQNDEHGAARAYHQLGSVAEALHDFDEARKWYEKSLEIELKQNNEYGAALSYHQLGGIAAQCSDFDEAEKWCKKSLEIKLRQNDEHEAAKTYCTLGNVAKLQGQHIEAGKHYIRAMCGLWKYDDTYGTAAAINNFIRTYQSSDAEQQRELLRLWEDAGLPGTPGSEALGHPSNLAAKHTAARSAHPPHHFIW